jgi:murein DD-endopeptidase MepM/ murein hydrolase activator NlpD
MTDKIMTMAVKKRNRLRTLILINICLLIAFFCLRSSFTVGHDAAPHPETEVENHFREISGSIEKGETLYDIFKRQKLNFVELLALKAASSDVHTLRKLCPGNQYKIIVNDKNQVNALVYWIDDDNRLSIVRTDSGFAASRVPVQYEKRIHYISGVVQDNLIASLGNKGQSLILALLLSDIFSWDIDFASDLRKGDVFKIVAEGLYLEGEFKKYGNILSAEFVNNGELYNAYRFEVDGQTDYYDDEGKSLQRSFLKAPLSFRRISSGFSRNRFHPVLRIYRPHLGVDYAASRGTPVSTVGDGTIVFAGYKGQNGKMIIIRHPNGYTTYYGHLSKIARGVKRGVKVKQGNVIGYVGSTGLATGPHLDYRVKRRNTFVNPLTLKLPRSKTVPKALMTEFNTLRNDMNACLASITPPAFACREQVKDST